ncbi:hypothetical protein [Candidatus Manganitrophus noduliformans]|uniref:Uncharacterized protein n=1 Tax=Candidatus Manganitrophus noduliformans TaxID=2606439 RepID=A0A7X6DQ74_9BACT|nr:hypothetical protein [Candidatus Manganitrophus noduliformans]NKE71257.1 hypothetical protein [Candidatus Manganitrophus noduliformans]
MIRIPFQKNTILILTDEEFKRAVARGKGERRSKAFQERKRASGADAKASAEISKRIDREEGV